MKVDLPDSPVPEKIWVENSGILQIDDYGWIKAKSTEGQFCYGQKAEIAEGSEVQVVNNHLSKNWGFSVLVVYLLQKLKTEFIDLMS